MKTRVGVRIVAALGAYAVLVVVGCMAFTALRRFQLPLGRYLVVICGPSLALFTHMSVPLFVQQSALVLPWLLVAAISGRLRRYAVAVFVLVWVGIGWFMHDLWLWR